MHALECCVKWQVRRRPAVQVHRGAQQLRQQNRFIFSILFFSSIFLMIQRLFKKKFISRYLPTVFVHGFRIVTFGIGYFSHACSLGSFTFRDRGVGSSTVDPDAVRAAWVF